MPACARPQRPKISAAPHAAANWRGPERRCNESRSNTAQPRRRRVGKTHHVVLGILVGALVLRRSVRTAAISGIHWRGHALGAALQPPNGPSPRQSRAPFEPTPGRRDAPARMSAATARCIARLGASPHRWRKSSHLQGDRAIRVGAAVQRGARLLRVAALHRCEQVIVVRHCNTGCNRAKAAPRQRRGPAAATQHPKLCAKAVRPLAFRPTIDTNSRRARAGAGIPGRAADKKRREATERSCVRVLRLRRPQCTRQTDGGAPQ